MGTIGHRCNNQSLPVAGTRFGEAAPCTCVPEPVEVLVEAGTVYIVVDVVDWEGRQTVRVFSTAEAAEEYAQEHYREATGRMTVDTWTIYE